MSTQNASDSVAQPEIKTFSDHAEPTDVAVVYLAEGVPEDVRETVCKQMSRNYGGFTKTTTEGGWMNPDTNELVEETVVQVEAARSGEDSPEAADLARSLAEWVQDVTDEHTVMWEVRQKTVGFEN